MIQKLTDPSINALFRVKLLPALDEMVGKMKFNFNTMYKFFSAVNHA